MAAQEPTSHERRSRGALASTLRKLTGGKTLPVADSPLSGVFPGVLVDGRYRVLEKLGQGGMGAVFKVEHVRMGKWMALKLLLRQFAADKHLVVQFEQEAQIASKLSCPNTVSVFDFGEIPDFGLYMAMEYVPGRDLDSLLEADGPFSERAAIGIGLQVLHSLAEAHDAGIIHRDIKPANVMLLRTREAKDFAKVLDFGIAKLADSHRDVQVSGHGQFVGTPEYASPEQALGGALDPRSDLYSLAAMLFELVAGRPPFTGDTPTGVLSQHITTPAPRLLELIPGLEVSPRFDEILQRALAKEPGKRYPSADAMRADLEVLASRYSDRPIPPPVRELREAVQVDAAIAQRTDWDAFELDLRRSGRRRRALGIATAALLVCGTAIGVWAGLRRDRGGVTPRLAISAEVEPNNDPVHANLIHAGEAIRGTIGPRLSDTDSDLDCFRFDVPGPDPARVRIEVTAVPNVNLALELYAGTRAEGSSALDFRATAKVDDQPLHSTAPEVMDDLLLGPGSYVVQLSDRRRLSEHDVVRPRENSTDRYELRVDLSPPDPYGEIEPDNTPQDRERRGERAIVERGHPVWGHTGAFVAREASAGLVSALWSDDEYRFRLTADAHEACALLIGARDASLELAVSTPGAVRSAGVAQHGHELVTRCFPAVGTLDVRVSEVAGQDFADRYLLVVFDDGADGAWGVDKAAELLEASGRADEARRLVARAIADLPKAPGASALRSRHR